MHWPREHCACGVQWETVSVAFWGCSQGHAGTLAAVTQCEDNPFSCDGRRVTSAGHQVIGHRTSEGHCKWKRTCRRCEDMEYAAPALVRQMLRKGTGEGSFYT